MKKVLQPIAYLLLSLFTFSACSFGNNFRDDAELTARRGVLERQAMNDAHAGTHLLVNDDGVLALRSLVLNLSDPVYLNNKVEVVGVLHDDDVFDVSGISLLERTDMSDADLDLDSGSFRLYKSTDLGFQLSYASNWDLEADNDKVVFLAPSEVETDRDRVVLSHLSFDYQSYGPNDSSDLSDTQRALFFYYRDVLKLSGDFKASLNKIGEDGLDAIKFEDEKEGVAYYVYRNGFIYKLGFEYAVDHRSADDLISFNAMVSSFKFLGFTVENNQKPAGDAYELTYDEGNLIPFESLPYHFAGRYPADWYYSGSRSGDSQVLHHYGFAKEAVENGKEIISLDVFDGAIPNGTALSLRGANAVSHLADGVFTIYLNVADMGFRVSGPAEYKDLIIAMAANIHSTKSE